jgi:predicted Zn-dependent protease
MMRTQFYDVADYLMRELRPGEIFTLWFAGERSDFVRFNRGKVRQPGSVEQRVLHLRLIREGRQASVTLSLSGGAQDHALADQALRELREIVAELPEDPYLLYATEVRCSERIAAGTLARPKEVVEHVTAAAARLDLVGIYAAGMVCRGFANSLGQRNWHEVENFNFECSLYHQADKAVKTGYAGNEWQPLLLGERIAHAAEDLALLARPSRSIAPGKYRCYFAPRALDEILSLLSWGGFSEKARRTKRTPLLRMEHGETLSEKVTLTENTIDGVAPAFQGDGFVKRDRVTLLERGELRDALIAPRTAKEYELLTNGASSGESPESLEMSAGILGASDVLAALDTGIYVNNLWYLNFSDRAAGRLTGMTRFATFWVERGRIVAPLNVMRFDDSIYRMLGEKLAALTRERELLLDASTYGERSTSSSLLPGALVEGVRFTL